MKNQFLIVDDDALARSVTARLVEHITGCEVESCGSGEEALRIFQDKPGVFACVVTDFEMLAMDGLELGGRLRALDPEVSMVLITGNPGGLGGIDISLHGFDCMLAKPFTLATMRKALCLVLPEAVDFRPSHPDDPGAGDTSFFEKLRGILRAAVENKQ